MRTVFWQDHSVRMIDQRRLPEALEVLTLCDAPAVAAAIRDMAIRGAPAIGAAAAYGLALAAATSQARDVASLRNDLLAAADLLRASRPTAVNLGWALDHVMARVDRSAPETPNALRALILAEAERIADADVATNRRMGANGAAILPDEATVIHHCNTGALAAVDYGTALGVVRAAHEAGKRIHVLVDETRPRLQGAKLTTWELGQLGIPHTLIVDGAAGYHLASGRVAAVLVGADRVAANGDTANKIGTYPLAVVARENGVPFYVVAPTTTVDLAAPDGAAIPIEMRDPAEVTHIGGIAVSPTGTAAANPAFDITPHRYISAIVTEAGVVRTPYDSGLRAAVAAVAAVAAEANPA